MDDSQFRILCSLVRQRSLQTTGSRVHADKIIRILKVRRSPYHGVVVPKRILGRSRKQSTILDALVPTRDRLWIPPIQRRERPVINLKNFSFIDDPRSTMAALVELTKAECSALEASVNFEDDSILDIGPYLVWGLMRQDMIPFMQGGKITLEAQSVIEAVDLRQFMNMGRFARRNDPNSVFPFKLKRRKGLNPNARDMALQTSTKEKVADDLVAIVNQWLSKMAPPRVLTVDGIRYLQSVTTEVLDNAERHSKIITDGDGDWAIAGFMIRREIDDGQGHKRWFAVCHLAIVSVGSSIAESIRTADAATVGYIDEYCRKHSSNSCGRDTLATVYALQDGISRVPQNVGDSKGGTGMMDVAEFASRLGQESGASEAPQITIISGSSCVMLRPPYQNGEVPPGAFRRLQWFNPGNSIDVRPDQSHVFDLTERFPGTVISLRFALPAEPATTPAEDSKAL